MKNKHGDVCRLSVHIKSEQTVCVQSVAGKCVLGYIIRTSLSAYCLLYVIVLIGPKNMIKGLYRKKLV